MGFFEKIFKRPNTAAAKAGGYFKMLNGYTPVFTNAPESVYEMEITRAAIHQFANFCSKLQPQMTGSAKRSLENTLSTKPNPFMDTSKFIYRLATILSVNNTAFIVPLEDRRGELVGYYPLVPSRCEAKEYKNTIYLVYKFASGQTAAIEFDRVGVLTTMQYDSDLFGTSNSALRPTMQMLATQNQGIIAGVKNSAAIRFIARVNNIFGKKDIDDARKAFSEDNLGADNNGGLLIYDNKFTDLKQVESKPFLADSDMMQRINENVYSYFGTNEKILTNSFNEDEWNAYYEGKIEPFAIQLSLVMTNMTFSPREIACGNKIVFSANRLQYASNATKLSLSTQFFDRGLLTRNQIMDIFNLPPVEDGDKYYIRKEYAEVSQLGAEEMEEEHADS